VADLTTERGAETRAPDRPVDSSDGYDEAGEAPSAPPGVVLSRLLSLVRLTPAQALEIGVSLLTEAATRSEPNTGDAGSPEVRGDRIVVRADGRVVWGRVPEDGNADGPPAAPGAVTAVLADVVSATRLHPRPADGAGDELLAELDRAVEDLPRAGVAPVAHRLRDTARAVDRPAVRAELAALVAALGRTAGAAAGGGGIGASAAAAREDPARRVTTGERKRTLRRVGAWVASVLILTVVVVLEIVLLRDDISTDIDVLLEAGRSGSQSSAEPEPDGLPIDAPAPAAAGNVTAVDLRAVAPCRPGVACALRLQVRLIPGAEEQAVTWSYRIVDRCTGTTTSAPGGTVTVPGRGGRAAAVGTVALPKTRAVAVIAVTGTPAVAASAPVLVGSCLSERSGG
jgi:hypothetical protein